MKLLEYEAKALLRKHGVPVPNGQAVRDANEVVHITFPVVVKVQIPKGGRGKAGGIKLVQDQAEYQQTATALLGSTILDCKVSTLLVEEALHYERELYIAIAIDRAAGCLELLAHRRGGVEIEQTVTVQDPMVRLPLTQAPDATTLKQVQAYFGLSDSPDTTLMLQELLSRLYQTCVGEDALLVEINPLMELDDGSLVCADAKIELDDAAEFRHTDRQLETPASSSQFVVLNNGGTIASMANGAGLAMATVDAIKGAGADPANFYDVGGGTNVDGMVRAFERMADMPNVRAIVVNIFGGITRCDEVAEAIIAARKICKNLPKLYIRLTGTNEAQGKKLLDDAGIALYPTLADCVREAVT